MGLFKKIKKWYVGHCINVVCSRDAKKVISQNLDLIYRYLYSIRYEEDRKNRFEDAEATISKCPYASLMYAKDFLKGRFELGENAIAGVNRYVIEYARDVLKELVID